MSAMFCRVTGYSLDCLQKGKEEQTHLKRNKAEEKKSPAALSCTMPHIETFKSISCLLVMSQQVFPPCQLLENTSCDIMG